jgi:TonB-dependent starch-binding outer membrane protein SusC
MKNIYQFLNRCASIILLMTLTTALYSQTQVNVTGTIADETGSPLPGVSIAIKGTTLGTITDAEGKYSITVADNAILLVSFIGFKTQEVAVGSRSTINVGMEPDVAALDEVVVTGYSIENRKDVVGAVSTVKVKDLVAIPSGNVEQQLQGRVAGVTVIANGQPGSTSQIRVRGFGAFGGNEPLYVVDGVPVFSIDFLNPNDIESTTVLKDAASASIYGARAANGVIIYTTKKGSRGSKKINITYDGMFGFTDPGKGQDLLNPTDFAEWTWNAIRNTAAQNGVTPSFNHPQFGKGDSPVIPDYLLVGSKNGVSGAIDLEAQRLKYNVSDFDKDIYQVVAANKQGTDWFGAITRTAPIIRNTIGINGGTDKSRFYFGFGMQEQDGILNYQKLRRYTFRANSEFDITKNLRIGENMQLTYRQTRLLTGGGGGAGVAQDENDILQAFRMPSIIPVYDAFGGYAGTRAGGFNNPRNPVANLDRQKDNRGFETRLLGNIYLEFEPIKGLIARTSLGGNGATSYFWSYFGRQYENSENNSAVSYSEGSSQFLAWTLTNTINYKKQFDLHNIDVLLGQEALNTGEGRFINGTGLNPFSEDRDFVTLNNTQPGNTRTVGSDYFKGVNFNSYFGRINYAYNDKYIATFVLRRDGSSRFGAENKYGVFPAFSAGWRITSEPFMKAITWVEDLKIRGGYGVMGNSNNVDPNNQFSLYATGVGNSSYPIDNSSTAAGGFYRSRIGNSQAKWEKAITTNIGFDGIFLGGKLEVVFDVWQKNTEDLLFQVPIVATNGPYASAPSVNIGKMSNRGIDIQVISRGRIKRDITYEVTVNGGFLKNEIVSLAPGITYLSGSGNNDPSYRGIRPIRNQEGRSISAFYGYQVTGLFQTAEEVASAPQQAGAAPGRFRYADINGDHSITADDRTYLGSPVPKFTGGITLKLGYKGFELESYMFTSIGNKIWNQSRWFTDFYPSFAGAAISARVKDSWTPTNTGATLPIFENVSNFSTNTQASSFYIEDGSYFRMQNVTLAYNLPLVQIEKFHLQKLRVFAGVNNVFTITGYKGLDPSVGGDVDTRFGIDVGNYPLTRSWTFGLGLVF